MELFKDRYITDLDTLTRDTVDALSAFYPEKFKKVPNAYNNRALLTPRPRPNRVNVVVSSGGGCLPLCFKYVGDGMADAAICGNSRAAPSAYDIYEACEALGGRKGFLLVYNAFTGDIMNNEMAQELLGLDGVSVECVPVGDDRFSVATDVPRSERTGLTGMLYVIKAAAAAAQKGMPLAEVARVARKANERMASLSLVLDFEQRELQIGGGFSGEPPVLVDRDAFTMDEAAKRVAQLLFDDLKPRSGEKLHWMVSKLDRTRDEEALIMATKLAAQSAYPVSRVDAGIFTYLINNYGFFVTLLCADEELESLLAGEMKLA